VSSQRGVLTAWGCGCGFGAGAGALVADAVDEEGLVWDAEAAAAGGAIGRRSFCLS